MSLNAESRPDRARGEKASGIKSNHAGPENLARLESNLRRNRAALHYLFRLGLTTVTIGKFHLGIKEPYRRKADGAFVTNVLCYPLLSLHGEPLGRYGYVNVPGVTENAPRQDGWSPGRPSSYFSSAITGTQALLVVDTCQELWLLDQYFAGSPLREELVVISPSSFGGIPAEWKTTDFWKPWTKVYFGHRVDSSGERRASSLARYCGREVFRLRFPEDRGGTWIAFFTSGGTAEQLGKLLAEAQVVSGEAPLEEGPPDQPGEFAVAPVNINGAFVGGHLYYPFTVERRELEVANRKGRESVRRVVTSYVTKVLRSDGAVLDVVQLAAPRGTPRDRRVLALTDGTRIEAEPQPGHYATWQLDSLQTFIKSAQSGGPAPHRPLGEILTDVSSLLRSSVWLPHVEDYGILALYVALSFVYQVFDAVPLIFIHGEKGTGKSELGDAMAGVSCNATVIGQGSAAGIIRLLNGARGLIVLDDLEAIGRSLKAASFGDISQMLKLGYKKRTGRKAITDRAGRTVVFDFYGPKVINNTSGVDHILGSRMLHIQTRAAPDFARESLSLSGADPEEPVRLRNELHVWGMANATIVHERYTRLTSSKGDRQDEISMPLRAIADLSGDGVIQHALDKVLERHRTRPRAVASPIELLKEAIRNCIRRGAVERLSAAQINLELMLLAGETSSDQLLKDVRHPPEWIGHQLLMLQIRDSRVKVGRVRLYGVITRVYSLRADYVRTVFEGLQADDESPPSPSDPLAFCVNAVCTQCPYENICAVTIRGLKSNKLINKGRGGCGSLAKQVTGVS